MAYIDYTYYHDTFSGKAIPEEDFDRLAGIASDIIDVLMGYQPQISGEEEAVLRRAAAYETEMLYLQGGVHAAAGYAETLQDVPVSDMTLALLRRAGLTRRVVGTNEC